MEMFGNSIAYRKSRSSDDIALNISDMDTLEDTGSNTKIADSVYSNSYSNSLSRSHRSNSGSNFSGSSGYGGKPSTSGSSSDDLVQTSKKDKKDAKKKKQFRSQTEAIADAGHCFLDCLLEGIPQESITFSGVNKELTRDGKPVKRSRTQPRCFSASPTDVSADVTAATLVDTTVSSSGLSSNNDKINIEIIKTNSSSLETSCEVGNNNSDGFSCAISLQDGVVIYVTRSVITKLGYPKNLWIGRPFVDFIHPKDQSTFITQITRALAIPAVKVKSSEMDGMECSMVCRIRRYRSLDSGFGVQDKNVTYLPFVLKFSSNIQDGKVVYLIITATAVYSAFKTRNERLANVMPFTMRHTAAGIVDYIDIASVPYLGYLPQEIQNQNALLLCHPEDLQYLTTVYENIVKEGSVAKSLPYRMLAQNGDYVKLQTEWSSFISPWSKKLEFVVGIYYIVEGPNTPDVFMSPQLKSTSEYSIAIAKRAVYIENIQKALSNVLRNPEEDKPKEDKPKEDKPKEDKPKEDKPKEDKPKEDKPKEDKPSLLKLIEEKPKVDLPKPGPSTLDIESINLRALSPHSDCITSEGTEMSYKQLNYHENLQRYFDSQSYCCDENLSDAEDYDTFALDPEQATSNSLMSPMSQCSGEPLQQYRPTSPSALELQSRNSPLNEFYSTRLTVKLLTKHDTEMQKEFAMNHREGCYINKYEDYSDTRQKTIEHLARCNASFKPTDTAEATQLECYKRATMAFEEEMAQKRPCLPQPSQLQCYKRDSMAFEEEMAQKRPCLRPPSQLQCYKRASMAFEEEMAQKRPCLRQPSQLQCYKRDSMAFEEEMAQKRPCLRQPSQLQCYKRASMAFEAKMAQRRPCMRQPSLVRLMTSADNMEGLQSTTTDDVFPMSEPPAAVSPASAIPMDSSYWPDAESGNIPQTQEMPPPPPHQTMQPFPSVPMIWPDSAPSQITPSRLQEQRSFDARERLLHMTVNLSSDPSEFATTSYLQITEPKPELPKCYKVSQRLNSDDTVRTDGKSSSSSFPSSFTTASYSAGHNITDKQKKSRPLVRSGSSRPNSDETFRTDGDSSCSSFYSSFFNTESSSAGTSIAPKKSRTEIVKMDTVPESPASPPYYYTPENPEKTLCRDTGHPWSELAYMNTELEFKYQVPSRPKEEILKADAERFENFVQPPLMSDQLEQMFQQMQLASQLLVEDHCSISNSSWSSDESNFSVPRPLGTSRKESKSELQIIYEEDAPIPSPSTGFEASSSESSEPPPDDLESSFGEPPESPLADLESSSDEPSQSPPTDLEANSGEPSQFLPSDLDSSSVNQSKSRFPPSDLVASLGELSQCPPTDREAIFGEPWKYPPADLEQ